MKLDATSVEQPVEKNGDIQQNYGIDSEYRQTV